MVYTTDIYFSHSGSCRIQVQGAGRSDVWEGPIPGLQTVALSLHAYMAEKETQSEREREKWNEGAEREREKEEERKRIHSALFLFL